MTYSVTFSSIGNFSQRLYVNARALPSVQSDPRLRIVQRISLSASGQTSVILTVLTNGKTSPGRYSIIVTGSSGTLSQYGIVFLTVFPKS